MIIPDEQGNTQLDPERDSGLRWMCELGRLGGGHAPNVLWLERTESIRPWGNHKREAVRKAMQQTQGDVKAAARLLGISRTTVYAWLK